MNLELKSPITYQHLHTFGAEIKPHNQAASGCKGSTELFAHERKDSGIKDLYDHGSSLSSSYSSRKLDGNDQQSPASVSILNADTAEMIEESKGVLEHEHWPIASQSSVPPDLDITLSPPTPGDNSS